MQLGDVRRRHVQAWVDAQYGAAQTIRNAHAVLRRAFAAAAGDSTATNPAIGVELPDPSRFSGSPLTAAEARRLLEVTHGDRLHALWRLALVTGLREGELLGLSRDALDGSTLVVDGQLQRIAGRWVTSPPKAGRKLERLAVDPETVAVIREHLQRMADERQPGWRYHGLMFVTPRGEPYHGSQILNELRRALAAAGADSRRFHDLRVTAATIMRDIGIAEDTRMARLGHATKAMARHYSEKATAQDRAAVEQLAEAIGG
jgi:integrase